MKNALKKYQPVLPFVILAFPILIFLLWNPRSRYATLLMILGWVSFRFIERTYKWCIETDRDWRYWRHALITILGSAYGGCLFGLMYSSAEDSQRLVPLIILALSTGFFITLTSVAVHDDINAIKQGRQVKLDKGLLIPGTMVAAIAILSIVA